MRAIRHVLRRALAALAVALLSAGAARADDPAAATLRDRYAVLQAQLGHNAFQRPLVLRSGETADAVSGDVHALIDSPFDVTSAALANPADWCDILLLHINTKICRASTGAGGTVLSVRIGSKHDEPIAEASRVEFAYRVPIRNPAHLLVRLDSAEGPMGTRDYRIVLEAIPLEGGRTFIHLGYSYGYDLFGRLAMGTYLATAGRDKVGFTPVGAHFKAGSGPPGLVGGVRGVMERNTMRYYLAIEAFLGALAAPPQARFEKRIRDWFAASERYPLQLHELGRAEYLGLKRAENLRQQAAPG